MTSPERTLRKAGLFYLVFVMFSYTTGGPFGIEDMVTTAGPGMTLLYIVVLPFFVHPGFAGLSRTDRSHARRRRLLSLDPRRLRRFLGISRWMV